jgi:hypothetical protein
MNASHPREGNKQNYKENAEDFVPPPYKDPYAGSAGKTTNYSLIKGRVKLRRYVG